MSYREDVNHSTISEQYMKVTKASEGYYRTGDLTEIFVVDWMICGINAWIPL